MRVLLSGGGTGGHVYPAIAIANKIKEKHPEAEILFVGTENGIESEIVPKEGFDIKTITVQGFRRKIDLENMKRCIKLCKGMCDARKIVKEFDPDIVIGTGGYVSGPVVFNSVKKGRVTFIHEQNSFPGITNKILAKRVSNIGVSFKDSIERFSSHERYKISVVGTPVREELLNVSKTKARNTLNVPLDKKMVLCYGGSGGFDTINNAMISVIRKMLDDDIAFIFATGKNYYEEVISKFKDVTFKEYQKIVPYLDDMANSLAASDLVIGSAGATSLAEITAVGKASIIIPKSYTAENHQEYNAKSIEKDGAGVCILESEATEEKLQEVVFDLLSNDIKRRSMEKNSYAIGSRDSIDKIYELLIRSYRMRSLDRRR